MAFINAIIILYHLFIRSVHWRQVKSFSQLCAVKRSSRFTCWAKFVNILKVFWIYFLQNLPISYKSRLYIIRTRYPIINYFFYNCYHFFDVDTICRFYTYRLISFYLPFYVHPYWKLTISPPKHMNGS